MLMVVLHFVRHFIRKVYFSLLALYPLSVCVDLGIRHPAACDKGSSVSLHATNKIMLLSYLVFSHEACSSCYRYSVE